MSTLTVISNIVNNKTSSFSRYIKLNWFIYLLVLPGLVHCLIFRYIPMYGVIIAFKKFNIVKGFWGSPWVGLHWFKEVFGDPYFYRVLWNTVIINIYSIMVGTLFVIFLALMLNEIRVMLAKRVIQTFVYLPNFVSWVVFAGLVTSVLSPSDGILNKIIVLFSGQPIYFLIKPELFRGILVLSSLVKGAGYSTIIYLAAISGINLELYESAIVDGAHRGHMMWHITIPRILPTIAVLLILNVAGIFNSNFEQVFTLYNPLVYSTGDVLSTYLYRVGLVQGQLETSTALGLMLNSVGLCFVLITNKIISKMNVTGIF